MEGFVAQNLCNGSREVRIQAATQLGNLNPKQRHKLAERGVIAPLISMLQSQDHEAIEAALFALLSLAFGNERLVYRSLSIRFKFICPMYIECGAQTKEIYNLYLRTK